MSSWPTLGTPAPTALVDARLQLHRAAQIAASVGYTFVAPEPDWGHVSLAWRDGMLVSRRAPGADPFRVGLGFGDLMLHLLDGEDHPVAAYALHGRTVDDGYAWLAGALKAYAGADTDLVRPDHELPAHPVADGGVFTRDEDALTECSRWYETADRLLHGVHASFANASPVRCWPHHFDIALLLQYDPDDDPEEARSIGVGLSPGDGSYAEPYWYLQPWPPPAPDDLPPLADPGAWHTRGWVGATLPASRIVDAGDGTAQAARARRFLRAGIAACQSVLAV